MKQRSLLLFLAVLLASVGCDHATKQIARSALDGAGAVSLAGETVRLELTSNRGAFLSLGAGLPAEVRDVAFLVIVPVILAALCWAFLRSGALRSREAIGLALVVGGGGANWLDRLLHEGAVTDFVSLGLGTVRTGIFNLADLEIMLGAALVVAATWRSDRPRV